MRRANVGPALGQRSAARSRSSSASCWRCFSPRSNDIVARPCYEGRVLAMSRTFRGFDRYLISATVATPLFGQLPTFRPGRMMLISHRHIHCRVAGLCGRAHRAILIAGPGAPGIRWRRTLAACANRDRRFVEPARAPSSRLFLDVCSWRRASLGLPRAFSRTLALVVDLLDQPALGVAALVMTDRAHAGCRA